MSTIVICEAISSWILTAQPAAMAAASRLFSMTTNRPQCTARAAAHARDQGRHRSAEHTSPVRWRWRGSTLAMARSELRTDTENIFYGRNITMERNYGSKAMLIKQRIYIFLPQKCTFCQSILYPFFLSEGSKNQGNSSK